ncbi:hypothetical protein J5N97_000692 [Dioscorea zingiberensis]|uniref:15-cis-phytoene synthase n=1 Tax=Dioscorea zingiberensis TaxID=325984 RepID=A0A9D5BVP2_9LILI|nr:hypothetical protein J5N97_000692 [Dioscorea zingiberensis]
MWVLKQAALVEKQLRTSGDDVDVKPDIILPGNLSLLSEAYDRCREVCAEYAKTFYLGTLLMTPERRRAIWAIYVWCRRTDELVDGPNASHITPQALDRWESRLERSFPRGMRMDLRKSIYKNFDELYLYFMGIAPDSQATTESVYNAALALGIANQLTNILRDVGEEMSWHKLDFLMLTYMLERSQINGEVSCRVRLREQGCSFDEAEKGVMELSEASRWPELYRGVTITVTYGMGSENGSWGKNIRIRITLDASIAWPLGLSTNGNLVHMAVVDLAQYVPLLD